MLRLSFSTCVSTGGDDGIRSRHELRGSVFRGSNSPPDCYSTPLPLLIPLAFRVLPSFELYSFLGISLGGDDGIRTHDPLLAGQVLSQLSYTPIWGSYFASGTLVRFPMCWHRPIFPCSRPQSIFGTAKLNFCVRNGNRWTLCVNNTNSSESL